MWLRTRALLAAGLIAGAVSLTFASVSPAEDLPWQKAGARYGDEPTYAGNGGYDESVRQGASGYSTAGEDRRYDERAYDEGYGQRSDQRYDQSQNPGPDPSQDPGGAGYDYRPDPYSKGGTYDRPPPNDAYRGGGEGYQRRYDDRSQGGYGDAYAPPPAEPRYDPRYQQGPAHEAPGYAGDPPPPRRLNDSVYEQGEIVDAGHRFFGSISEGLGSVIEYAFQSQGRPNGYILGQDAGGAFVLGLRYGEGKLHTKDLGSFPVYWQGPSLGYDAGAEGSKTMVLVYNLRDPSEIYNRFAGVQGAAYLVGGVSLQFQKYNDVVLGIIRSGVGLRLGANVGYLKYTRTPTWNPL